MKVIGIDPSLTCTGIASNLGWTDTVGQDGVTTLPLPSRVAAIDHIVASILELAGGDADLYVIESPSLASKGGAPVERHALYWLLLRNLLAREKRVATVAPSQRIMYALGKGVGSKTAIADAVARRFPAIETGGNDNVCDALILAAMGADYLSVPMADMPQTHRRALAKVAWPE